MSVIRINIIDQTQVISGDLHGSFGELLVASLTAEPETIAELETALVRFIKPESDWSVFRSFKNHEDFNHKFDEKHKREPDSDHSFFEDNEELY